MSITDQELHRRVHMDMGDSYYLLLPDNSRYYLGYSADGAFDYREMLATARRVWERETQT